MLVKLEQEGNVEWEDEFVALEDGYKYFFPKLGGGLSAFQLRMIAADLDAVNAEWDAQVKRDIRPRPRLAQDMLDDALASGVRVRHGNPVVGDFEGSLAALEVPWQHRYYGEPTKGYMVAHVEAAIAKGGWWF